MRLDTTAINSPELLNLTTPDGLICNICGIYNAVAVVECHTQVDMCQLAAEPVIPAGLAGYQRHRCPWANGAGHFNNKRKELAPVIRFHFTDGFVNTRAVYSSIVERF